jgi:anti-sigma factor RsiW
MLASFPARDCVQAREAASALLDDELSELDAARLDAHLDACAQCRRYLDELHAIASGLRRTPLEQPRVTVLLPARRRRFSAPAASAAAAALVAVAGTASFFVGHLGGAHATHSRTATQPPAKVRVWQSIHDQTLLAMLSRSNVPERPSPGLMRAI